MRVLFAIGSLVFGIVCVIAMNAAVAQSVERSYHAAPPQYQHYYPTTDVKPKIGRAEDLSAVSNAPELQKIYNENSDTRHKRPHALRPD